MNTSHTKAQIRIYRLSSDPKTITVEMLMDGRAHTLYSGAIEPDACVMIRNLTIVPPRFMQKARRIN